MKWVTREKVKVDRVACPWLIRKFVDPQAEFLFVPADQVMAAIQELSGQECVPMFASDRKAELATPSDPG